MSSTAPRGAPRREPGRPIPALSLWPMRKIPMESLRPRAARRAMASIPADAATCADTLPAHHGPKEALPKLMLGAIGVVYGDIGTSPLYTMKESFLGPHPLAVDRPHILGVLSLIFWSLMFVVTIKYVFVAMRADNRGEGGSFALLSLIARNLGHKKWAPALGLLGVLAAWLFSGDAMTPPAISVLSAVEGLTVVQAGLQPLVIPISVGILVGLFAVQSHGTTNIGGFLGAVILIYMAVLAVLGGSNIRTKPEVLQSLSP